MLENYLEKLIFITWNLICISRGVSVPLGGFYIVMVFFLNLVFSNCEFDIF